MRIVASSKSCPFLIKESDIWPRVSSLVSYRSKYFFQFVTDYKDVSLTAQVDRKITVAIRCVTSRLDEIEEYFPQSISAARL